MKIDRCFKWTIGMFVLAGISISCQMYAADYKIGYEIKNPGGVSLAIYDSHGRMIKEILISKKQEPGKYEAVWDGTDKDGELVPPGTYTWKAISANIKAEYKFSVGNTGDPPYRNREGTGGFGGFNPMGVTIDEEDGIYLLFRQEEGEGLLQRVSRNGILIWQAHVPSDVNGYDATGQTAVTCDKDYVYVVGTRANPEDRFYYRPQEGIWRVDKKSGEHVPWGNNKLVVYVNEPRESKEDIYHQYGALLLGWQRVKEGGYKDPKFLVVVRGLAVFGNKIYVPLYFEDKIAVYDQNGIRKDEITGINKPQGVAVNNEGVLYVASGEEILKVTLDGKILGTVIKELSAPWGVALDKQGNVYITDLGTSQQIKKFSPEGKLLLTIGKEGGDMEFNGRIYPDVLRFPLGISVTNDGSICVADSGVPMGMMYGHGGRFVVYDNKGKFITQWMNTGHGGAVKIGIDMTNPSILYTGAAGTYRFNVDYKTGKWTWDCFWANSDLSLWGMNHKTIAITRGMGGPAVRHGHNGQTYIFMSGRNPSIWKFEGDRLIPSTVIGSWLPRDLEKGWEFDTNTATEFAKTRPGFTFVNASKTFVWIDKNGDGKTQEDELEIGTTPDGGGFGSSANEYIDEEMNIYIVNIFSPPDKGQYNIYKLPCLGFDKSGNPIYSWEKAQVLVRGAGLKETEVPDQPGSRYNNYDLYIIPDKEGNIYASQTTYGKDKGLGWASSIHDSVVTKWNNKGEMLWRIGKKATGFAGPGMSYRLCMISGIEKGFLFVSDVQGPERIYTTDGLYAGSLLGDLSRAAAPGPYTITCENFMHRVFTHPKTNITYLLGGYEQVRYFELKGINEVEHMKGTIKVE